MEGLQLFKLHNEEYKQSSLILPVTTVQATRSWKAYNDSSSTMKFISSPP
jgi:hypothetical protein